MAEQEEKGRYLVVEQKPLFPKSSHLLLAQHMDRIFSLMGPKGPKIDGQHLFNIPNIIKRIHNMTREWRLSKHVKTNLRMFAYNSVEYDQALNQWICYSGPNVIRLNRNFEQMAQPIVIDREIYRIYGDVWIDFEGAVGRHGSWSRYPGDVRQDFIANSAVSPDHTRIALIVNPPIDDEDDNVVFESYQVYLYYNDEWTLLLSNTVLTAIAFSPDGTRLIAAGFSMSTYIFYEWDKTFGEPREYRIPSLHVHSNMDSLAVMSNNDHVLVQTTSHHAILLSLSSHVTIQHFKNVRCMVSPRGRVFIVCFDEEHTIIEAYDGLTGLKLESEYPMHVKHGVNVMAMADDETCVLMSIRGDASEFTSL